MRDQFWARILSFVTGNQILGIVFKKESGYLHTEALQGARASLCGPFRKQRSPASARIPGPTKISFPHAWLEFDVDNVEKATRELESQGIECS